jgi:hypothetical protein
MSGAIHPLPNAPSWRGAKLKHRDNFILISIATRIPIGAVRLQWSDGSI